MPLVVQLGSDPASAEPIVSEPGKDLVIPVQLTRREGFSGPVDLVVRGLPGGARADNIQIPQDQSQGTIQVKWENAELAPGPYTIYLEGKTTGKYARNQDAVAQLKQRREQFQTTLENLRSEAEGNAEVAEKLKNAEAYAQQLDAQLKAVEEQNKTVDLPILLVSNSLSILAPKAPGKD
jgi:hypothetical protein